MSRIKWGGAGDIPHCEVRCEADEFENYTRDVGVVFACEWFGHAPDIEFTAETIKILLERSGVDA